MCSLNFAKYFIIAIGKSLFRWVKSITLNVDTISCHIATNSLFQTDTLVLIRGFTAITSTGYRYLTRNYKVMNLELETKSPNILALKYISAI